MQTEYPACPRCGGEWTFEEPERLDCQGCPLFTYRGLVGEFRLVSGGVDISWLLPEQELWLRTGQDWHQLPWVDITTPIERLELLVTFS